MPMVSGMSAHSLHSPEVAKLGYLHGDPGQSNGGSFTISNTPFTAAAIITFSRGLTENYHGRGAADTVLPEVIRCIK